MKSLTDAEAVERVRMCLAEAGYDPRAVTVDRDGRLGIVTRPGGPFPWVPKDVARRAIQLATGETPSPVHREWDQLQVAP